MKEKKLTIKAKTLEEAIKKLYQKIPSGFFLVDLHEFDAFTDTSRASGNNTGEAVDNAKKAIHEYDVILKENIVRNPRTDFIIIHAFDESEAEETATFEDPEAVKIVRVHLAEKGSNGFLGIGKKPNSYRLELFYEAIAEVEYMVFAELSAEIIDNIDIAKEDFLIQSKAGNYQVVRHLLQQGIDIHARDDNGATALILSAFKGHSKISNLLIDNGIDINIKDQGGFTALMVACECVNADINLIKRLIDLGADVNATSEGGATALMAAAKIGHFDVVELLVSNHAKINARNANHNVTPLIFAADGGHLSIVEFLLKNGADPHILTNNNYTAATIAKENGHYSIVEALNQY